MANSSTSQTLALHFDGTSWQVIPSDNPPAANGVFELSFRHHPGPALVGDRTRVRPSKPPPADGTHPHPSSTPRDIQPRPSHDANKLNSSRPRRAAAMARTVSRTIG